MNHPIWLQMCRFGSRDFGSKNGQKAFFHNCVSNYQVLNKVILHSYNFGSLGCQGLMFLFEPTDFSSITHFSDMVTKTNKFKPKQMLIQVSLKAHSFSFFSVILEERRTNHLYFAINGHQIPKTGNISAATLNQRLLTQDLLRF